ncbi:chromo domain-containing protein [Trichonephila clavata]|uniref:Chromo domain-containing protein n=1 Tax=Trichonephila clavata TaxID=2740835 RepID=A0A8X6LP70_TRICU|nr:chromo domain-containing protein [Trichonephila clavata]
MFRVFTYRKSYKYEDVLQSLVKSYNNSKHRSIGMAPSKVTRELEPQIFKKLYGYYTPIRNPQITLKEDDLVRISKANKPFRRGYLPGWSDEVFTVAKVYHSYPTTYKLQDMKAEAIKGRFYAEELQKISKLSDDYWHVEKVLKTKGSGRKKEYYVKWKGFDNRFNSWVKAAWMK